jgi:hypothetical protein
MKTGLKDYYPLRTIVYLEFEFCFANTAHHEANTLSDVFWGFRAVFAADKRLIPETSFDLC